MISLGLIPPENISTSSTARLEGVREAIREFSFLEDTQALPIKKGKKELGVA
jgi:hypothetical protein